MLIKIISGGQTGADIAGLKAAKAYGIPTGGYIPKGCKTLDGLKPEYIKLYDLTEIDSVSYAERTRLNVMTSDMTLRFAFDWGSRGEKCTERWLRYYDKPHLDLGWRDFKTTGNNNDPFTVPASMIAIEIDRKDWQVINIAGNSEKTWPGMEEAVYNFLTRVFEQLGFKLSE